MEQIKNNSLKLLKKDTQDSEIISKDNMSKRKKQKSHSGWSVEENMLYIAWLCENFSCFRSEFHRRSRKVFLNLSSILENRSPQQCRSHHQKMMKKNKSLEQIVDYLLIKAKKKGYTISKNQINLQQSGAIQQTENLQDSVISEMKNQQKKITIYDTGIQFQQKQDKKQDLRWDDVFSF